MVKYKQRICVKLEGENCPLFKASPTWNLCDGYFSMADLIIAGDTSIPITCRFFAFKNHIERSSTAWREQFLVDITSRQSLRGGAHNQHRDFKG